MISYSIGCVYFNAYHGCLKCTVIGEYDKDCRNISFQRTDMAKRTDYSFRNRIDPDHHKFKSPLEELPIDMVADFPIADPLHILELGIMKRCILAWTSGRCKHKGRWSAQDMIRISDKLEECNITLPCEIHRAIRRLDCVHFWKGIEFRTLLLYTGIVVLKDFLSEEVFNHFLLLFCASTILSCQFHLRWTNVASQMLNDYINKFKFIFGHHSLSSNVHNLCHIVDDVQKFGQLNDISAYPFESALGQIKKLIRSGNKPLTQAAKRLVEINAMTSSRITEQQKYPVLINKTAKNVYNKLILKESVCLNTDGKNKWFMTRFDEIVEFKYAQFQHDGSIQIIGLPIFEKENYFTYPFNSSHLSIYAVSKNVINTKTKTYTINDVKCKTMQFNTEKETVFLPLLHSLDLLNENQKQL